MTIDELLAAYEQIREAHDLPKMFLGQVEIKPTEVQADPLDPATGSDRLAGIIQSFGPTQGWLCYQSAVIAFPPGGLPKPDPALGLLLSGELANADQESLHIRQDGRGGWRVTRFTPGQGKTFLVDDQAFIAHTANSGDRTQPHRLCYRRYWTTDDDHGVHQTAACFIGFDGGN